MLVNEKLCTNGTSSCCTYAVLLLVALMSLAFSSTALAQGQHGIGLVKGCQSPVVIGDPLFCAYTIINTVDTGDGSAGSGDTLTISSLEDFVCNGGRVAGNCLGKNAQPPVPSGDILPLVTLTFSGGATCNGTQTLCTLPPGSTISTDFYTHYNVEVDDENALPDEAVLVWQDTNDSGSDNPPVGDQVQITGGSVNIIQPQPPEIAILKEVSVDGGATWYDANIPAGFPPVVDVPAGAMYRITVTNTGPVDLVNVTVDDPELAIAGYVVGDLAVGASALLTSSDIPALDVAERCDAPGIYNNVSFANGESAVDGGAAPEASDPANMECASPPEIDILKEVSVDGGATWYDANLPPGFPPEVAYPAGAMYRITVTNTGSVDLVNVTVDDPELGIAGYVVGDLAAGASVLLTSGDIAALDVAVRCTGEGTFTNIAFANGDSALTGTAAPEAQDPASMVCVEPIARVMVTKIFSDGNTAEVDVLLTCDTGLPLQQPATIAGDDPFGVVFVVTEFIPGTMSCELTETSGPDGYTPVFNDGDGCVWTNMDAGLYICEISNLADFGTFTAYKDWEIFNEGGDAVVQEAWINVECTTPVSGGSPSGGNYYANDGIYGYRVNLIGNDSVTVNVSTSLGSAACRAFETGIGDSGVVMTSTCDDPIIVDAGQSESCRITNTVFFEGIPTLSQYGLALLALLMLGVGMVGFRRFA